MDIRLQGLTAKIKEWVKITDGRFTLQQIDSELGIQTPQAKNLRRGALKDLCNAGILERIETLSGVYRRLDIELKEFDWQHANIDNVVSLRFPFELEKYVKIYPKSIICLAGGKNEGKTAWLYDFTLKNMFHPLGVDLYNSETGREQMKERMQNFKVNIPNPAPFRTFERYDNFADVIDKDRISVIDYLDLNSEVYLIGDEIDKIFRKLDRGIAVIGLQKPPPTTVYVKGVKKLVYRDLAYGSGFTAKRAALYISMDNNVLKLVVAKTPLNPKVNPTNMMWVFWLKNGAEFIDIQPYEEQGGLEL